MASDIDLIVVLNEVKLLYNLISLVKLVDHICLSMIMMMKKLFWKDVGMINIPALDKCQLELLKTL